MRDGPVESDWEQILRSTLQLQLGKNLSPRSANCSTRSFSLDISENAKPADAAVRENIHPDVVEFLFGLLQFFLE